MPHGTWLQSEGLDTLAALESLHPGAPTVIDLPDDRGFLGDIVHGASIVGQAVLGAAVDIVQTPQRIIEDVIPGVQFPELDPEGWAGTQWGGGDDTWGVRLYRGTLRRDCNSKGNRRHGNSLRIRRRPTRSSGRDSFRLMVPTPDDRCPVRDGGGRHQCF